jgi:MFS family permease
MEQLRQYPRVYYEMLLVGFSIIFGMGLVGSFLPIFAKDLDPSGELVGVVVSAWFLVRVFIEIPSGLLSDRIGRRRLFLLGIVLSVLGSGLSAIAPTILFLILGRAVWGLGIALFFLNNTAILFDLFDPAIRGRAVSTFQGIEFIGSLIGGPVGGIVAGVLSYNTVFYLTLLLTSGSLVLALTSKAFRNIESSKTTTRRPQAWTEALAGLTRWPVMVICTICFTRMFIMNGVMSTIFPLYLHENLGFAVSMVGLAVGARTGGFTLATLASGYLTDRISRKTVIILGLIVEAPCLIIYTVVDSFPLILVLGFFDALGAGLTWTTLTVFLADVVDPSSRGLALGLYRTFMDVGGILGPIVFVAIAAAFTVQIPFVIGACCLIAMAGLMSTVTT